MPGDDRKGLAVQALARSATVSDLSTRHRVSRKFVYQQADKARHALDDAFSATTDDTVNCLRVSLGISGGASGDEQGMLRIDQRLGP
jgi:hypothetical protein